MGERRVYTTAAGIEVPIKPISTRTLDTLALKWHEVENIKPPTYTVKIADGDESEEIEHDLTTLETDDAKQAWADYQERLGTAIQEYNDQTSRTLITFGIDMDPPDDGWETDFEFCGIPIPEGPDRKVFYFQRVLLTDPVDEQLITRKINLMSRLSGEALDRADALFRGAMEAGGGMDSTEQIAGEAREVETQRAIQ